MAPSRTGIGSSNSCSRSSAYGRRAAIAGNVRVAADDVRREVADVVPDEPRLRRAAIGHGDGSPRGPRSTDGGVREVFAPLEADRASAAALDGGGVVVSQCARLGERPRPAASDGTSLREEA